LIWIDVEDLFAYVNGGDHRPTGIQRVAFELCRAMRALPVGGERVRFVRHATGGVGLVEVPWSDVTALFDRLTNLPAKPAPEPEPEVGAVRRLARSTLPAGLRRPLGRYLSLQWLALIALADLLAAVAYGFGRRRSRLWHAALARQAPTRFGKPGDILLAPGAGWSTAGQSQVVAWARQQHGLRFALLVYDLIPLRRPDLSNPDHVGTFRAWLDELLPLCDRILTISRATANDLQAYARAEAKPLAAPVNIIPVGSEFRPGAPPAQAPTRQLPAPGSYVLFVSTVEARKNHALLVNVWRRLREVLPPASLPKLVFAGRVGWMVRDLMQQLDNSGWLDGQVMLVNGPADGELAALYRGCLFTVFPSLYEGWGMPVTESLSFGKPCVISNSSSLPEAGGDLARYFDPEDVAEATRVIRATIEDRDGLSAWEERIRREFRPVSWEKAAECLLRVLDDPPVTVGA
jgi:glycosyltransferase involved in cell wall biosynthesis